MPVCCSGKSTPFLNNGSDINTVSVRAIGSKAYNLLPLATFAAECGYKPPVFHILPPVAHLPYAGDEEDISIKYSHEISVPLVAQYEELLNHNYRLNRAAELLGDEKTSIRTSLLADVGRYNAIKHGEPIKQVTRISSNRLDAVMRKMNKTACLV